MLSLTGISPIIGGFRWLYGGLGLYRVLTMVMAGYGWVWLALYMLPLI